jgi:hypothetical protein
MPLRNLKSVSELAHSKIPEDRFQEAWEEDKAMTLDQAIALDLEQTEAILSQRERSGSIMGEIGC